MGKDIKTKDPLDFFKEKPDSKKSQIVRNKKAIAEQFKEFNQLFDNILDGNTKNIKNIKLIKSMIKKINQQALSYVSYISKLETEFFNTYHDFIFMDKTLEALENLQEFSRLNAIEKDKELKAREAVLDLSTQELKEMDKIILSYELVTDLAGEERKERDRILKLVKDQQKKIEKYANDLEKINNITEQILHSMHIETIIKEVFEYLKSSYGFEGCGLALLNKDKNQFKIEHLILPLPLQKNKKILAEEVFSLDEKKSSIAVSILNDKVMDINYETTQNQKDLTFGNKLNMKSSLLLPIKINEEKIGVFILTSHSKSIFLSEKNIDDIKKFVTHLACIIKNARLYEEINSEKLFSKNIIENSPYAIQVINKEGRLIFVNSNCEKIYGMRGKDLIGLDWAHDKSIMQIGLDKEFKKALEGNVVHFDKIYFRSDFNKKDYILNITFSPIRNSKGEVLNVLVNFFDDSKRVLAEHLLQEAKDFAESIIHNAPISIYTTDINGTINSENPAMEKLLGDYKRKVIGRNVFELPSYKNCGFDKSCKDVLEHGKVITFENVLFTSSITGKKVIIDVCFGPIYKGGKITGMVGNYIDVEGKYNAEQALREAKDFAESIIHNAPISIYTTDINGTVNTENPAMEKLLGDYKRKVIGRNVFELPSYKNCGFDKSCREVLDHGKLITFENVNFTSSITGKKVIIDVCFGPIYKGDKITGMVGNYIDVEGKYKAEQALREAKDFAESIIQNAPLAIYTTDINGTITSENPAMKKILEDYTGKAVGSNIFQLDSYIEHGLDRKCKEVLKTGEIQQIENLRFLSSLTSKEIIVNQIFAPFYKEEKIAGLICMYYDNTEKFKAEQELKNAIIQINEDLFMAKKVQTKFLSSDFSKLEKIKIKIHFEPMIEVGGDIYDIHALSDKHYRILLADAAGHGVQAALLTMLIKNEYDWLKHTPFPPNKILTSFNHEFTTTYYNLNVFFTCCVIDIDLNKNKIYISSAGHPNQFIIKNNQIYTLEGGSSLVGFRKDVEYKLKEYEFNPGDRLLLFTDGLLEEFNEQDEELDYANLEKIVLSHVSKDIENLIKDTLNDVKKWIGKNKQNDDITVIGLEYLAH